MHKLKGATDHCIPEYPHSQMAMTLWTKWLFLNDKGDELFLDLEDSTWQNEQNLNKQPITVCSWA